jgi:hypothetical protein
MDQAVIEGALKLPGYTLGNVNQRRTYLACKWIPQGWQWVDPQKEFGAMVTAIRAGLLSRSEAISSFGYDAEDIDREIAADNARADSLGLVFESDPRHDKPGVTFRLEFHPKHGIIPASIFRDTIVGNHQGSALCRRQMIKNHHRHHAQAEFIGSSQPSMPGYNNAISASQDWIGKSKLRNRRRDLHHLVIGMGSRISGVGQQVSGRPLLNLIGQPRCGHAVFLCKKPGRKKKRPESERINPRSGRR